MNKQSTNHSFPMAFTHALCILGLYIGIYGCEQNENAKKQALIPMSKVADSTAQSPEIYIDLAVELKKHPKKSETVAVAYDAFFKTAKTFKGYALAAFLDSIVAVNAFDTTSALVVFECKDGYKPVMDMSKVMSNNMGYIVYKDVSQKNAWADSIAATFTPYYVSWTNVKKADHTYMWPYGLVGIRLKAAATEYKAIYPYHNADLVKGFMLFRNNCMRCHAINKVGGSMGPELNAPKNITEYWTEEDIISFVKSPTSFRFNSQMPAVTGLTDAELQEIVAYLKGMKEHKVL